LKRVRRLKRALLCPYLGGSTIRGLLYSYVLSKQLLPEQHKLQLCFNSIHSHRAVLLSSPLGQDQSFNTSEHLENVCQCGAPVPFHGDVHVGRPHSREEGKD